MKYVFILVLLIVASTGALLGGVVVYRFVNNMTQTAKYVTGERVFPMPSGVVARGGTVILPREQREAAAKIPNPVKPTAEYWLQSVDFTTRSRNAKVASSRTRSSVETFAPPFAHMVSSCFA